MFDRIFYTSGTTADPKGARHSDATIVAGARGVADRYEMVEADRYPVVFPFTHIGGVGMLAVQLLSGAGAIVLEQYDPERSPPLLRRHDVTIPAGGTPLALLYLQYQRRHPERRAFPKSRAVMTGAAPKPPGLDAELRDEIGGVGAVSVYGLTEAPFLVVGSVRDPAEKRAAAEGRAIDGVELRAVAEDGHVCASGEVGELRARGVVICDGYVNGARDADAFDDDGYFRTGDLGSIDADGFVTVSGRLKDVIIRKGENISAKEVEDVLYTHPKVAEVAVIGLPDPQLGERCCAVVLAADGADAPTIAELTACCAGAGLAKQKWPEQVEVVRRAPAQCERQGAEVPAPGALRGTSAAGDDGVMDISVNFPPGPDALEHIKISEDLGFHRAWLNDSPAALLGTSWMTLALAAERFDRIGVGVSVVVPSLRHVLVTASAIATAEGLRARSRGRDRRHRVHGSVPPRAAPAVVGRGRRVREGTAGPARRRRGRGRRQARADGPRRGLGPAAPDRHAGAGRGQRPQGSGRRAARWATA